MCSTRNDLHRGNHQLTIEAAASKQRYARASPWPRSSRRRRSRRLKEDSESEEEDLDFVVADSDDGSRDGDDDLDRAEGKRKRDSSSDEDSSDSDSDSDDDDDIDHVMSKDEVAALKKDQGNVIPRAKRRAALASGIGDASALEAIQQAKPDSDEEAEFEFWALVDKTLAYGVDPVVVPLGRPAGAEPTHQPGERALAPRFRADDAKAVDEGDEVERVGRRPRASHQILLRPS